MTATSRATTEPPRPRIELLWFHDCPNHPAARALLDELLGALAPGATVDEIDATDPAVAPAPPVPRFTDDPDRRPGRRPVLPGSRRLHAPLPAVQDVGGSRRSAGACLDRGRYRGEPRPGSPFVVTPWPALEQVSGGAGQPGRRAACRRATRLTATAIARPTMAIAIDVSVQNWSGNSCVRRWARQRPGPRSRVWRAGRAAHVLRRARRRCRSRRAAHPGRGGTARPRHRRCSRSARSAPERRPASALPGRSGRSRSGKRGSPPHRRLRPAGAGIARDPRHCCPAADLPLQRLCWSRLAPFVVSGHHRRTTPPLSQALLITGSDVSNRCSSLDLRGKLGEPEEAQADAFLTLHSAESQVSRRQSISQTRQQAHRGCP